MLWIGCVAASLEENDYRTKLAAAGFEQKSEQSRPPQSVRRASSFSADSSCRSYFIPRSVRILGLFSPDATI
jgi:hypothetical protein